MTSQAQVEEMFGPIDGTSVRRMFGGLGVFRRGIMFALVADDVLYMKADESTSPAYEAEGCSQWVYDGRGRQVPMPYWRLPDRLYDELDEFRAWALAAFAVAQRTAKPKKAAAKAAPRAGRSAAAVPATRQGRASKAAGKAGKKTAGEAGKAGAAKRPAAKKPTARRASKKPKTARSRLVRSRR